MTGPLAQFEPPGSGEPGPTLEDHRRGSRLLGNRGFLISTASTLVFFGALLALLFLSPGSKAFIHGFFSLPNMKRSFFGVPSEGLPAIWRGFVLNVEVFLISEVLILNLALVIAVVRQIPGPVFLPFRIVAIVYTDFFRGTPLLLVLFIFGFGIPALDLRGFSSQSPVVYGAAALVLSYSAYVSEVYRAGIQSVHASQVAAARSLGLTRWQSLRFVVLPQAIRRVIPPLLNDFVSLQKDTALLAVLGTVEAARAAQIYSSTVFNFSSYTMAAILFILMTIPLARFTDHLIERDRRRRAGGGG